MSACANTDRKPFVEQFREDRDILVRDTTIEDLVTDDKSCGVSARRGSEGEREPAALTTRLLGVVA